MKPTLGRRIAAMRELGGFKSVEALADAVAGAYPELRGASESSLRNVEKDATRPNGDVRRAIADVCKVPYGFLTFDLADLNGEAETSRVDQLEEDQALVMEILEQAVVPLVGETEIPRLLELLDELDRARERRTARRRSPRRPSA